MRDLELMVDGERNRLIEDGLNLERLSFKDDIARRQPNLGRVPDLRAIRFIFPCVVPRPIKFRDQRDVRIKGSGAVRRNPCRSQPGIDMATLPFHWKEESSFSRDTSLIQDGQTRFDPLSCRHRFI